MLDTQTVASWRGHELIDRDGDKIGTIESVYLDRETEQPEWITVKTGLFGTRQTFVPIRDATSEGEIVRVPFEKSHVKDAPNIGPEQELSQAEERELYDHYGVDYGTDRSGSQLPQHGGEPGQEPMASAGAPSDAPPVRSESAAEPETAGTAAAWRTPDPASASGQASAPGTASAPGAPVAAAGEWQQGRDAERDDDDAGRGDEGSPTPDEGERGVAVPGESDADEGERGVAVPGESDADEGERSAGERRLDEGATTERVSEEPATGAAGRETRLRLKRYVVTEEVRVPIQREEVRVERDEG